MTKLQVSVPEEFIALQGGREAAQHALSQAAVLDLVRRRAISTGRGAELLDTPVDDFIHLMAAHGISYLDYDDEELAHELQPLPKH